MIKHSRRKHGSKLTQTFSSVLRQGKLVPDCAIAHYFYNRVIIWLYGIDGVCSFYPQKELDLGINLCVS